MVRLLLNDLQEPAELLNSEVRELRRNDSIHFRYLGIK